jgi:hypothetical protein
MSELEAMAGIENTTTMTTIIVTIITAIIMAIVTEVITAIMATIRGMEDITGVETTIRAGRMIPIGTDHMIGIDKASIDCIVHPGDLRRFSGAARSISKS